MNSVKSSQKTLKISGNKPYFTNFSLWKYINSLDVVDLVFAVNEIKQFYLERNFLRKHNPRMRTSTYFTFAKDSSMRHNRHDSLLYLKWLYLSVNFITCSLTKRKVFMPKLNKSLICVLLILSPSGLYSQSGVVRWKH